MRRRGRGERRGVWGKANEDQWFWQEENPKDNLSFMLIFSVVVGTEGGVFEDH